MPLLFATTLGTAAIAQTTIKETTSGSGTVVHESTAPSTSVVKKKVTTTGTLSDCEKRTVKTKDDMGNKTKTKQTSC